MATLMKSDGTTEWSHTSTAAEPESVPLDLPVVTAEVAVAYETTADQKVTFFELRGCVFEGQLKLVIIGWTKRG